MALGGKIDTRVHTSPSLRHKLSTNKVQAVPAIFPPTATNIPLIQTRIGLPFMHLQERYATIYMELRRNMGSCDLLRRHIRLSTVDGMIAQRNGRVMPVVHNTRAMLIYS